MSAAHTVIVFHLSSPSPWGQNHWTQNSEGQRGVDPIKLTDLNRPDRFVRPQPISYKAIIDRKGGLIFLKASEMGDQEEQRAKPSSQSPRQAKLDLAMLPWRLVRQDLLLTDRCNALHGRDRCRRLLRKKNIFSLS